MSTVPSACYVPTRTACELLLLLSHKINLISKHHPCDKMPPPWRFNFLAEAAAGNQKCTMQLTPNFECFQCTTSSSTYIARLLRHIPNVWKVRKKIFFWRHFNKNKTKFKLWWPASAARGGGQLTRCQVFQLCWAINEPCENNSIKILTSPLSRVWLKPLPRCATGAQWGCLMLVSCWW